MKVSWHILPVIVIAQFCCTSLWFAGNGVMTDLIRYYQLPATALGHLTAAVQLGFICGTLLFAIFTVADRYSPTRVFLVSAILGAAFNLGVLLEGNTLYSLLAFRFLCGVFLAGIYPVGMKIAADHFEKGLGKSLGFLVGALVVGTAFPHLLRANMGMLSWEAVLWMTSALAVGGGLMMLTFVPDGPYRKAGAAPDFTAFFKVFSRPNFRKPAFGYFGHMWELYAFWAFIPFILQYALSAYPLLLKQLPFWSFVIIGVGGPACVISGYLSQRFGAKAVASVALATSGLCCLLSPLFFYTAHPSLLIAFLILWGMAVVADSPLFSTLVAQNAMAETRGTALTIVNCLGFAITVVSIQLLNFLREIINPYYLYGILALGPVLGLMALWKKANGKQTW